MKMSEETPEEYRVKGLFPGGTSILAIWGLAIVIGIVAMMLAGG